MPIIHAIVLGLVQGLSEFLPISSSGHLRIVPWLFGWDDFEGNLGLEKTFDVALHLGTLVGVVAYFRRDLVRLARAGLSRDARSTTDGRMAWLLVVSAVPAAITGALLADPIEEHTGQIWLIALMLMVFGVLLAVADRRVGNRALSDVRLRDALAMGVGQAVALQPGVSRSGVTITVGRWCDLGRDAAARFAFLMSLPITAGALVFKGVDALDEGIPDGFLPAMAWGVVASGLTGWLAVWGTLRLVRTRTFTPFVAYRLVLGAVLLVLYFFVR